MTKVKETIEVACPSHRVMHQAERFFTGNRPDAAPGTISLRIDLASLKLPGRAQARHDVRVEHKLLLRPGQMHTLRLSWDPEDRTVPRFAGTLDSAEADDGRTLLTLQGEYEPPLGVAGAAFDAVVGRRIASGTLRALLQDLKRFIESEFGRQNIAVRQMTLDDVPAAVEVRNRAFAGLRAYTADDFLTQMKAFPEGQLVAVDETGRILGTASSLIIDWDDYSESAKWSVITDHGTFSTHNPLGKTLYGADMGVDPVARRRGIASLFYEERKKLVKERGLKRILTGGRIPGYEQASSELSPREYVAEVVMGKRTDPTLSAQLANGFVVLDVVPSYIDDGASRGFATLLEWLNPAYVARVSLQATKEAATMRQLGEASLRQHLRPRRVRIAAMQYLLRPINSFEDFAGQVSFFVRSARGYRANFVVFPEFFSMQLLSYLRDPAPARAVRRLAELTPAYEELFARLASETGMYIIAGTHPVLEQGEVFNAAHLFTPKGLVFRQKKVHLTPVEKGPYQLSRGHGFYLYHTDFGKIGILVCYDVEFPEAARLLAEAGAQIIFVPSCTDGRHGFCRVRYCAQARAIENQVYVAMSATVGNLPEVPYMNTNYGQAAILTPSDYFFARDGIANEGIVNQEQMIVADVDLELLDEQRITGSVIPLTDVITDAYDHVIHSVDQQEDVTARLPGVEAELVK